MTFPASPLGLEMQRKKKAWERACCNIARLAQLCWTYAGNLPPAAREEMAEQSHSFRLSRLQTGLAFFGAWHSCVFSVFCVALFYSCGLRGNKNKQSPNTP